MLFRWIALVSSASLAVLVAGCSSASDDAAPAPAASAPPASTVAAAPAPAKPAPVTPPLPYPAFTADPPQVESSGGKVLPAPKFVLVHYAGDSLAAGADTFVSNIGASSYWSATTKEYGVAAAVALPSIEIADAAPATIDDVDIGTWLASQLDGTHPEFPVPDGATVYVLVYPKDSAITKGTRKACTDFFGYHSETPVAGHGVPYVVAPRCSTPSLSDDQQLVEILSHELVEVALDPFLKTAPAYLRIDSAHDAWDVLNRESEPADLCAGFDVELPTLGTVQRSWSNAAAKAGHDPCVPAPAGPYVSAVPVLADTFHYKTTDYPAVAIEAGQTRTIAVQLSSDAPSADFTVAVHDVATLAYGDVAQLSFHLDKTTGHNGDVLHLTIHSLGAGHLGTTMGVSAFVVVATSKTGFSYWPAFVAN